MSLNNALKELSTTQEPTINAEAILYAPENFSTQQGFYMPGDLPEGTRKSR